MTEELVESNVTTAAVPDDCVSTSTAADLEIADTSSVIEQCSEDKGQTRSNASTSSW